MKTKRWMTTCVVALLSFTAVLAKDYKTVIFTVPQLTCENCENKITKNIRFEKGVKELTTDLKTKRVTIKYDADKTNVKTLQEGFKKINYEAQEVKSTKSTNKKSTGTKSKTTEKKSTESNSKSTDKKNNVNESNVNNKKDTEKDSKVNDRKDTEETVAKDNKGDKK